MTGGSEPQARMTRPQDPDHGKWCGAWGGGRGAALQVPDLPAPRLQLLCCTCDLGAKRKRLFLRSVLQTWALRMVCSQTLLRAATRGRCPPCAGLWPGAPDHLSKLVSLVCTRPTLGTVGSPRRASVLVLRSGRPGEERLPAGSCWAGVEGPRAPWSRSSNSEGPWPGAGPSGRTTEGCLLAFVLLAGWVRPLEPFAE